MTADELRALADAAEHWPRLAMGKLATEGDCLVWTGNRDARGYGRTQLLTNRPDRVHRIAWAWFHDEWPTGQIHHVCRNKACVHPFHLRHVNASEHGRISGTEDRTEAHYSQVLRARTHCPKGHAYDEENTNYKPQGYRVCRACGRERIARKRARLAAA